jgi:hypothetical protein
MGIVLEEADESEFWLELVDECALQGPDRVTKLRAEAGELVAMAAASVLTARAKSRSIQQSSLCTQQSKCS